MLFPMLVGGAGVDGTHPQRVYGESIIAAVGETNLGVLLHATTRRTRSEKPRVTKLARKNSFLYMLVAMYSHHSPWKMVPLYFVLDYLPCSLTLKLKLVGYHSVIYWEKMEILVWLCS